MSRRIEETPNCEKVINLAERRAEIAARFPKVDEIIDRLSYDTSLFGNVLCRAE